MSTTHFPTGSTLSETLDLLNGSRTVILSIVESEGRLLVLDGEMLTYTADSMVDAEAFIHGIFLATYGGCRVYNIWCLVQRLEGKDAEEGARELWRFLHEDEPPEPPWSE